MSGGALNSTQTPTQRLVTIELVVYPGLNSCTWSLQLSNFSVDIETENPEMFITIYYFCNVFA